MSKQSRRPPQEEKPARRGWRGDAQNGATAGRAQPGTKMGWRQGRAPRNDLARKWIIGVPMIVVVLGLFYGWYHFVIRQPAPTPLVTAYVTDYESPLAPQGFALEDVEHLLALFRSAGTSDSVTVKGDVAEREIKATHKDGFLKQLREDLEAQKPVHRWGQNKPPQLIYLSAQGVLDEAGEPCLVLAAGQRHAGSGSIRTPRQVLPPERLVRIEDLVDLVSGVNQHADRVLLLDCVRSDRNWRLGVAANDFAAQLKEIKLDTPDRQRITIVHACSPGEVGLVDLGNGRTLFGEFVARGLAGEADKDDDAQVEWQEFCRYLQDRLGKAALRMGRSQQPLCLPEDDRRDFSLATADPATERQAAVQFKPPGQQPAASWLKEIHAGWLALHERRTARAGQPPAAGSLLLEEAHRQHLQQQLKYCLGGRAYARYRENSSLPATEAGLMLPAVSLPLALGRLDATSDQESRGRAALMPPPTEDKPPSGQALPPAQPSAADYYEMASVVWSDALDGKPAESFTLSKLHEVAQSSRAHVPVELRTLERFSAQNGFLPKSSREASEVLLEFLVCRHEAERAAFLQGQPRVLGFVRERFDAADDERRQFEDRVFGAAPDSEGLGQSLGKLTDDFQALRTEAEQVASALAVRDRLWADLPYLLEWAVAAGESPQAEALLEALAALESKLAARDSKPADWAQLSAVVEAAERGLIKAYADEWQTNVVEAPARAAHSQTPALARLLASPLANLDERHELWKKYWSSVAGPASVERPENYEDEAARVAGQHPDAIKLLERSVGILPGATAADSRRLPASARFLGWLDAAAVAIRPVEAQGVADGQLRDQVALREPVSRAAASWLTLVPTDALGTHLIGQGAELSAHDYCLWQARRSLDDFLGNADRLAADGGTAAEGAASQRPYFAVAAEHLLQHAEHRLFPRRRPGQLLDLLDSRENDAEQLGSVVVEWPREKLATGQNSAIAQRFPQPLDLNSLPNGQAALQLDGPWKEAAIGEAAGSLTPVSGDVLLPVTTDNSGWPARIQFTLDPDAGDQNRVRCDVSYYYRGHAGTHSGYIDRLQPRYRVVSASPGPEAKLSVDSPTVKANVVIMLDCSNSMGQFSGERTRFARGTEAVENTIYGLLWPDDLNRSDAGSEGQPTVVKRRSSVKVTLILFGHRRGQIANWPEGGVARIKWNDAFGEDTGEVSYDKDYQIVWRSQGWKSDQEAQDALRAVFKGAEPTGYTPLYGALEYALKNGFVGPGPDAAGEAGQRHLLVVSDGQDLVPTLATLLEKNNPPLPRNKYKIAQFSAPWDQDYSSDEGRRRRAKAIREAAKEKVKTYFFNVANDRSLDQVKSDLQLNEDQIVQIGASVELTPELLRRIGVRKYSLIDREQSTRLNGSSTMTEIFSRPRGMHFLQFAAADSPPVAFRIGGGEALEVTIPGAPSPAEFVFARHLAAGADGAARGSITLDTGSVEADYREPITAYEVFCRAEREKRGARNDEQYKFELVLQNKSEGRFTPRPVELWAEVVAVSSGGQPIDKFSFCNPFCVPGTRTPVYQLVVPHWPAGASLAQVSVWVRMQATSEAEASLVTLVTNAERKPASPPTAGTDFKFEGRVDKQLDKQVALVTVTEFLPSAGQSADPLHFVRLLTDLGLSRVERTYYDSQVEHVFFLPNRRLQDAQDLKVLVLPQERWKRLATGLDGGSSLQVAIPRE